MTLVDLLLREVSGPPLDWMPVTTALVLLASQPWRTFAPSGQLAQVIGLGIVAMLLFAAAFDAVARSHWMWLTIFCSHVLWLIKAYHVADNHHYLVGYWCLAVALGNYLAGPEGNALLGRSACGLIGLCFLAAVAAKLESPSYRNGSFFAWCLVSDGRFIPLASLCGGLAPELRKRHAAAQAEVRAGIAQTATVPVPRKLVTCAVWLTWWTVAIEGAVALAFLLPVSGHETARIAVLVAFVATTFSFVAVPAFGQYLLLMAAATIDDSVLRCLLVSGAFGLPVLSFLPLARTRATLSRKRHR